MARRPYGPKYQRSRVCRRCGANEWYKNRRSFYCAPCQRRRVDAGRKKRHRDPVVRLWERARDRAKELAVPFSITKDDVRSVFGERCPVFGWTWGTGAHAPSLDKLRPYRGYVPGNIAVISVLANRIKNDATALEVAQVALWMKGRGL